MPVTYYALAKVSLTSESASVSFTSIPQTYTDLLVKYSVRTNQTTNGYNYMYLQFNNNTSAVYSYQLVYSDDGATGQARSTSASAIEGNLVVTQGGETSTFSNGETYIPNYAVAGRNKPVSINAGTVKNATGALSQGNYLTAGLYADTSAITTVTFINGGATAFSTSSTFYLYGIKNS